MSVFTDMGKHAALVMNKADKLGLGYTQEWEAWPANVSRVADCASSYLTYYRVIQLLPADDKLQARQEFDNAYRQYRTK